eukprot:gene421-498_t
MAISSVYPDLEVYDVPRIESELKLFKLDKVKAFILQALDVTLPVDSHFKDVDNGRLSVYFQRQLEAVRNAEALSHESMKRAIKEITINCEAIYQSVLAKFDVTLDQVAKDGVDKTISDITEDLDNQLSMFHLELFKQTEVLNDLTLVTKYAVPVPVAVINPPVARSRLSALNIFIFLSIIVFALSICYGNVSSIGTPSQPSKTVIQNGLEIMVHLQGPGDMPWKKGGFVGTRGESRRLEGFEIKLYKVMILDPSDLSIEYMAHLQDHGDIPWQSGGFIGTKGESRRLEGFAIRLKEHIYRASVILLSKEMVNFVELDHNPDESKESKYI